MPDSGAVDAAVERRLFQLETLYEIGRECSRVETVAETLQVILSMVMGAFGAARGLAFAGDADGTIEALHARGFESTGPSPRELAEGFLSAAPAAAGALLWLPFELPPPRAGAVAVGPRFDGSAYTDDDLALLRMIVHNACPFVDRVQLLSELRRTTADLARGAQALAAANEIALKAFRQPGVSRLHRLLAEQTMTALGTSEAAVLAPLDGDVQVAGHAVAGEPTASHLIRAGVEEPATPGRHTLAAPLRSADENVGVLWVRRDPSAPAFNWADAALLGLLANQGALLIENARLLDRFLEQQGEQFRLRGMLEQYLAPAVAERLIAGETRAVLEGARLTVTVLMIDMRGSTELINVVEPEAMVRFLNGYFGRMTDILFRHEGTVDKFSGDAVLGFFGAPERHPDDPQRAVLAGLEMLAGFNAHLAEWRSRYELPAGLGVGIGIATGDVVVGNIGSAKHLEHTIIGSAVNLAARLSSSAAAGVILLDEATHALVRPHLGGTGAAFHGPRRLRVKGFHDLVPVFRLQPKVPSPGG